MFSKIREAMMTLKGLPPKNVVTTLDYEIDHKSYERFRRWWEGPDCPAAISNGIHAVVGAVIWDAGYRAAHTKTDRKAKAFDALLAVHKRKHPEGCGASCVLEFYEEGRQAAKAGVTESDGPH